MNEHEASRTLVKSPPELWAECSDADSLARHLSGPFGEIRITRLEPETTVAWEGERASGTVRLEPSGWGTRVTLTVSSVTDPERSSLADPSGWPDPEGVDPEAEAPEPDPDPEPTAEFSAEPLPRRRLLARLSALFKAYPEESAVPQAPAHGAPASPPAGASAGVPSGSEPETDPEVEAALGAALDSLGQAHHRPFSRA